MQGDVVAEEAESVETGDGPFVVAGYLGVGPVGLSVDFIAIQNRKAVGNRRSKLEISRVAKKRELDSVRLPAHDWG